MLQTPAGPVNEDVDAVQPEPAKYVTVASLLLGVNNSETAPRLDATRSARKVKSIVSEWS